MMQKVAANSSSMADNGAPAELVANVILERERCRSLGSK
jgi:hypothetical protein